MRYVKHAAALTLLVIAWSVPMPAAQNAAAAPARVTLTPEQMGDFLLNARIIASDEVSQGVTNTRRATLSDGRITHDASIQTVDISLSVFKPPTGPQELNFKDTYRYNIAGYRLAVLLGLDNVPMSVERRVEGKRAAVTWWIDDVLMTEGQRLKQKASDPNVQRMAMQTHTMRVFDELIQNRDRNLGNLVWTTDWKLWMIDHTRAFRLGSGLEKPALLERIERSLFENMQMLTSDTVTKAVGDSLTRFEIQAVLTRRDAIVKLFVARIAERGEGRVLYALPR